jgi:ParB-like chromosome segregation protein Spo0J
MTGERWQLLPALSGDEYEALKADIAAHGLRVPVVVDADTGAIVDGHHRQRAVEELAGEGVKVPEYRDVRRFVDDDERLAFAVGANLFRRHLSRSQRSELVARLRGEGWSLRRIAGVVGADPETVRRDLTVANATVLPERVVGRDGRSQPARRPTVAPGVVVGRAQDERRARQALATLGDEAPGRTLNLRDAERRARMADYQRMRDATEAADGACGDRWELRAGDFATVLDDLDAGSVDLVLTDPPYTDDFGARWVELSALCARVLRPGGVAVFYTGHPNLPEVISQLGEHLAWLWHLALVQPGQETRFMAAHIHNGHRDLLAYCAGTYQPTRWLRDTITATTTRDKTLHPWQQGLQTPTYLVDLLSEPGGLVLDPCCGSGTFGVAAIDAGRRFLGVDVDPVTIGVGADRLRQVGAGAENGAAS